VEFLPAGSINDCFVRLADLSGAGEAIRELKLSGWEPPVPGLTAVLASEFLLGDKTFRADPQLRQELQILLVGTSSCQFSSSPHAKKIIARGQ
jgi:hypothetical protein